MNAGGSVGLSLDMCCVGLSLADDCGRLVLIMSVMYDLFVEYSVFIRFP